MGSFFAFLASFPDKCSFEDKTQARLIKEHKPSEAERDLLARMTAIFDAQCAATLLMLGREPTQSASTGILR